MQVLTLGTVLAVFEEMLGTGLFWFMALAALVITCGYLFVLIRDRSLSMKKFLWAQVSMPFGAIVAILITLWATNSHVTDIGGPVDVIVFLGTAIVGAIGTSIFVYTIGSLFWPPEA